MGMLRGVEEALANIDNMTAMLHPGTVVVRSNTRFHDIWRDLPAKSHSIATYTSPTLYDLAAYSPDYDIHHGKRTPSDDPLDDSNIINSSEPAPAKIDTVVAECMVRIKELSRCLSDHVTILCDQDKRVRIIQQCYRHYRRGESRIAKQSQQRQHQLLQILDNYESHGFREAVAEIAVELSSTPLLPLASPSRSCEDISKSM
ncbi:hypothetical protein AC1031_000265 [Aphanomyces cochlioides]|nr:hypothetical protein AC1031_000265 [Aphanomyces cochlioides]